MNGQSSHPVPRVLESDAAGLCEPDGGACAVPGTEHPGAAGGRAPVSSGGDEAARGSHREAGGGSGG